MTGIPEVEEYYEAGAWLDDCLDAGVRPSDDGLRDIAKKLRTASERIEELLTKQPK